MSKDTKDAKEIASNIKKIAIDMGFKIVEDETEDAIVVVGGDGTLLRYVKLGKPIIGIKSGRRSALFDVEPGQSKEMLLKLKNRDYKVEEYKLLEAKSKYVKDIAFNDIAILFDLPETIYGSILFESNKIIFEGDGILVSTTQGSWAWGYAANRIVVHRKVNAINVSFLNCLTPDIRALILPDNEELSIKLEDKGRPQSVRIVVDGETVGYLKTNEDDAITIKISEKKANILRFFNSVNLGNVR